MDNVIWQAANLISRSLLRSKIFRPYGFIFNFGPDMHRLENHIEPLDWKKHETINDLVMEFQTRVFATQDVFTVADMLQYVREGEPRAEEWAGSNNVFSAEAEKFYTQFFETRPWLTKLPVDDGGKPRFQRNEISVQSDANPEIGLPFWPHDFRLCAFELSNYQVEDLIIEENMVLAELVDKFVDEMIATKATFCVDDMNAYVRKHAPALRYTSIDEFLSPDQLEYFEELCFCAEFLNCVVPLDDAEYYGLAIFQANGKASTSIPFPA